MTTLTVDARRLITELADPEGCDLTVAIRTVTDDDQTRVRPTGLHSAHFVRRREAALLTKRTLPDCESNVTNAWCSVVPTT